MEDYEDMASTRLDQPPAPRGRGRRWLLIGALAFAFMLALGVGVLLGSTQAAALASSSTSNSQTLADVQGSSNSDQSLAATPGARGQCDALTVSSVNITPAHPLSARTMVCTPTDRATRNWSNPCASR